MVGDRFDAKFRRSLERDTRGQSADLAPIFDPDRDDGAVKIHTIAEAENRVLYAGVNDNLWRCQVDD